MKPNPGGTQAEPAVGSGIPEVNAARPIVARRLPNFFIVGAAKAGTTSLHSYLSAHPNVFMSPIKEPHYFASFERTPQHDNFLPLIRDPEEYLALFGDCEGQSAVGEASPSYLCDPLAPARIRSTVPDAKIIISLRDPVDRAHSHYQMEYRAGRETRSFRGALEADLASEKKGWGVSFQYVELGLYYQQVKRYFNEFGKDRVLILLFQEVIGNSRQTINKVAEFLDIDPAGIADEKLAEAHNQFEVSRGALSRKLLRCRPIRVWSKRWLPQPLRTVVRSQLLFKPGHKPSMDCDTLCFLRGHFEEDTRRLEELLDRNLSALRESW